jgi:hypothetical protein
LRWAIVVCSGPRSDAETGFVGVVKSNIWAAVDFGTLKADKPDKCDVIKPRDAKEGRIEAPIRSGPTLAVTSAARFLSRWIPRAKSRKTGLAATCPKTRTTPIVRFS